MLVKFLVSFFLLTSFSVAAETPLDKTVFYIDDTEIRQSTFLLYYQSKGYKAPKNADEKKLQQMKVAQEIINLYLLSEEAEHHNLDKTYEVIKEIELARKTILMKAMVKKYSEEFTVSKAELDKAYKRIQQNAEKKAEYKLRNIVLEDDNKARQVIQQLDKGADFKTLEKKLSTENFKTESQQPDWLNVSMIEPEMASAISNLDKKSHTPEPVKTKFGWHVILVEDKKVPEIPPMEKIKNELTSLIKQDKLREKIKQLRAKVTIKTRQDDE